MKKTSLIIRICFFIIFLFFIFTLVYFNTSLKKNLKYLNINNIANVELNNNFFSSSKIKNKKKIRYFVQLGVFAKQNEVDKIRAKLSLLDLKANYKKYILNYELTTKITLGPYNKDMLTRVVQNLKHNNISKIKTSIVNKLIWIILFGYMGLLGWLIFILRKNNDLCNKYLRNEKFNHWLGCLFIVGTSIIIILYVFKQIVSNLI